MSDEYTSEVDLSRIDDIIDKTVEDVCKELGYLDYTKGFYALRDRINELIKLSTCVDSCGDEKAYNETKK